MKAESEDSILASKSRLGTQLILLIVLMYSPSSSMQAQGLADTKLSESGAGPDTSAVHRARAQRIHHQPSYFQTSNPQCDVNILVKGVALPKEFKNGHYYVLAKPETDYTIQFTCSPKSARCMAVCYVDGLSVVTQKPKSQHDPGYVIDNGGAVIPGYWLCKGKYAAFHFSDKKYSLATDMDHPKDIGYITTVFYNEKNQAKQRIGIIPSAGWGGYTRAPGDSLLPAPEPMSAGGSSFGRAIPSITAKSRVKLQNQMRPESSAYEHDLGTELGHAISATERRSSSFIRGDKIAEVVIEYTSAKARDTKSSSVPSPKINKSK